MRFEFPWIEAVVISMYHQGLNNLATSRLYTMVDVLQEESGKKGLMGAMIY